MPETPMRIVYELAGSDILESAKISEGLTLNHIAADVFKLAARLNVPPGDISMRFAVSQTEKEAGE